MFARVLPVVAAVLLGGCAPANDPVAAANAPAGSLSDSRTQGRALAAACEGRDGWSDAAPPARIFGNTYYVGTCGISVLLVASPNGHVLVDGATEEAAPSILANIRSLGFDPRDVRFIVGSHEHLDHMGGFAALQAATGATIRVRQPARMALMTGRTDVDDPQFGLHPDMQPVTLGSTLADDEIFSFGLIAMSSIPTPGHTSGGTSWTWQSCEGTNCAMIAYVDSLSAVSRDDYRFSDHPERVAPFRETFRRVGQMGCDILITPHPSFSDLFARLAGDQPLIDRDACRRLAHQSRERLEARLARESAAP